MKQDPRYKAVRSLFENEDIKSIPHIFKIIPKTIVATDLHVNHSRFSKAIKDPTLFTIKDLDGMAQLIGIDAKIIISMAYRKLTVLRKRKLK